MINDYFIVPTTEDLDCIYSHKDVIGSKETARKNKDGSKVVVKVRVKASTPDCLDGFLCEDISAELKKDEWNDDGLILVDL